MDCTVFAVCIDRWGRIFFNETIQQIDLRKKVINGVVSKVQFQSDNVMV